MCSRIEVEDSCDNQKTDIDEKSSIIDILVLIFDFLTDTILVDYPTSAERSRRLYRQLTDHTNEIVE